MEHTLNLIKNFVFDATERANLTFSDTDKIRLDGTHVILKDLDGNNAFYGLSSNYSTDDDIYVATSLWNPNSLVSLLGFDVHVTSTSKPNEELLPSELAVKFRLTTDGVNHLWWDGAAWSTPVAGEWNTAQEINDNISTFPIVNKSISAVVNLKTTDAAISPLLHEVKVLYSSSINFEYDIIYDSLLPYLESVRPITDYVRRLNDDETTMNLASGGEYHVDPFDIQDVVEVFNHDDDPNHTTNLLSDFNTSTKVLTLTSTQSVGKRMWIRFTFKPYCTTLVHQDYKLVEHVPAVILTDINELNDTRMAGYDAVRNPALKTSKLIYAPHKMTLRVTMKIVTEKNRHMATLYESLLRLFDQTPLLTSLGLDQKYSVMVFRDRNDALTPNLSDLKTRIIRFDILDVNFWTQGEKDSGTVTSGLVSSGDVNFTSGTTD